MALERAQQDLAEHDRCRALTVQMLGENDDVLSIEADDYRQTFQTNLFGLIEVCLACGPTVALD